jgi:hypothetical protein
MSELTRTLPASWYCSESLYQMERRAVFMKVRRMPFQILCLTKILQSWYLLGPVTRFLTVGEKVDYEVGQLPIYAVRVSGETKIPVAEELKVFSAKTVRTISMPCLRTAL